MATGNPGFVYVLQMEGHPYYKIGRTVNLTRRVTEISPQMPGRLNVVLARWVRDCHFAEKRLHDEFVDNRLNGEWFSLNLCHLDLIEAFLLSEQSEAQLDILIVRLRREVDLCGSDLVKKLCGLIYRATKRRERRLCTLYDFWVTSDPIPDDEILVAEAVA